MTSHDILEKIIQPVEKIKLAKPIPGIWTKVWALRESGELFCIDYLADDCKTGYIFLESGDGRNRGLLGKLRKYGLEELIPFVHKGQLLLMW